MTRNAEIGGALERLKMALAEAGWPNASVWLDDNGMATADGATVPGAVWWAAYEVAFKGLCESVTCDGVCSDGTSGCIGIHPCWSCWNEGLGDECGAGRCKNPDLPRWPDRSLLGFQFDSREDE